MKDRVVEMRYFLFVPWQLVPDYGEINLSFVDWRTVGGIDYYFR